MIAGSPDKYAIFHAAVELSDAAQRQVFLDETCAHDPQLRQEIEDLLELDRNAGSFLESLPSELFQTLDHAPTLGERLGTKIGPYKLLQQIGEGGMGVVYMAEQREPVKRRVALKIIKPGMDTRQVIARFEAERQALAMMDHPNIAKVLDAGATDSGRPYFVMELVNGQSVTEYCDQQQLTPEERLQLFIPICRAVQHAHQKGIIHRDLKPNNILVALYDGKPVPKVIDFGVAKATGQSLTDKTMFTQLGQVVGTLEYMSPEQAERNQLDVDTRSDVYALGVVLYELLAGETPFGWERLRSAGFDETLRIIREEEPKKPSVKVGSSQSLPTVAANRRITPARLSGLIRGELDWIVLKALEKDRARRYDSAGKFAEDVEHYLNGEPVQAAAPSTAYRFRKFARRNRAAIGTVAAIVVLLLGGITATTWQAVQAINAKDRAVAAERLAERRLEQSVVEKNRAIVAEQLAAERLQESEASRKEAQATLDVLYGLLKMPRETPTERSGQLTLAELQEEIAQRKVLKLDTDMLEDVYDFARSSVSFSVIESVVKERVSEQLQSVVRGGKVNRGLFSQLRYLANKVGMKLQLLYTVRPVFAKSVEAMIFAILNDGDVNLNEFNGVRELTEFAPDLVGEDLRERLRPTYGKAIEKVLKVPKEEMKANSKSRSSAYQLLRIGMYFGMKEVVPLALRVATTRMGWGSSTRRDAVYLVGKFGSEKDIEPLSSLLEDRTPLYKFGQLSIDRQGYSSNLGDEALAAVIHLSGGDLAEYGFARPGLTNPVYPDRWFPGWGFFGPSEAAIETTRQQAFLKWKARPRPDFSVESTGAMK